MIQFQEDASSVVLLSILQFCFKRQAKYLFIYSGECRRGTFDSISTASTTKKCTRITQHGMKQKIIEQKKSLQNKFFLNTHTQTHTRYISHPVRTLDTFKINIFSQFISSSSSSSSSSPLTKKYKKSPFYIPFRKKAHYVDTREMIMIVVHKKKAKKESLLDRIYHKNNLNKRQKVEFVHKTGFGKDLFCIRERRRRKRFCLECFSLLLLALCP